MFPVSEENTVKCLVGSSDILGNGRTSILVFWPQLFEGLLALTQG